MHTPGHHRLRRWLISWPLRLVTAALLAVDAYIHADLIARYEPNQGSAALSQGDLFRIEAIVASLAALALLITASRLTWVLAGLVAASALGVLLVYQYYDPGTLGPLLVAMMSALCRHDASSSRPSSRRTSCGGWSEKRCHRCSVC